MYFRQFLYDPTSCASYLFGCPTHRKLAVVDPHETLVGEYIRAAEGHDLQIVAVLETHVQADHVSGLPELVERTGATAYLPEGAGVGFEHHPLVDGEDLALGNTVIKALATPGHAPAHHTYLVTDHRRGEEPWLALTGDTLLVGAAGRPDLHAGGDRSPEELARQLYHSIHDRLLTLPDHLLLYPGHYAGSVCGTGLSATPASTLGFERLNNPALRLSEQEFVETLLSDLPPAPPEQDRIVAANRAGRKVASVG